MKKILVSMMAVAALVSCSKSDQGQDDPAAGRHEIMAGATTLTVDAATRTPINGAIPATGLKARVPVSDKDGIYNAEWQSKAGYMEFSTANTAVGFVDENGDAAAKFYPTLETASIYLCGLYPHDAWTIDATEGKTATCIFTGKEDVMAAPQQTTTKADSPNSFKTLDFQHLLTQLRIQFKAQNDEAANAWGEIASLKLLGKNGQPIGNKVTVNLKDGTSTGFAKDASGDLKFYQMSAKDKGTDAEYSQTGMTTTAAYKAYTLCPSVTADGAATAEYQLVITAAGGAFETVNLNLKADNSADYDQDTAGKAFDIILVFQATEIKAQAKIAAWTDMGTTEVPVGE